MNSTVSICIPSYEFSGKGVFFIKKNIDSCLEQDYENLEIIISDQSNNNEIELFVESYGNEKIKYFKNENNRGFPAYNTNNAIEKSVGDYIKIMNQDDYIENKSLIKLMVDECKKNKWAVSGFKHLNYDNNSFFNPLTPIIKEDGTHLLRGENLVGCPSVGMIPKNEFFDTVIEYMIDSELWYRMFKKYGYPGIVPGENIVIGISSQSFSSFLRNKTDKMIEKEYEYCKTKFNLT